MVRPAHADPEREPAEAGPLERGFARDLDSVIDALSSNTERGLDHAEAATRLSTFGPNQLAAGKPPPVWAVALQQLRDPMNVMLVAVVVVSILIGELSTATIVGSLVILNVVLGALQELKARASVDALATMQVPHARVLRDGEVVQIPASDLVPGDIVHLEAGDIVPVDGRIIRSATLEVQEAALTGESVPVAKAAGTLPAEDVAVADRTNALFQNTSVTRARPRWSPQRPGCRPRWVRSPRCLPR